MTMKIFNNLGMTVAHFSRKMNVFTNEEIMKAIKKPRVNQTTSLNIVWFYWPVNFEYIIALI
jgi:hypothetical protein